MHIKMEENVLTIERPSESKEHKSFHGLTRALLNNMIIGVNEGFKKELELVAWVIEPLTQVKKLEMALGFSHNVVFEIPSDGQA